MMFFKTRGGGAHTTRHKRGFWEYVVEIVSTTRCSAFVFLALSPLSKKSALKFARGTVSRGKMMAATVTVFEAAGITVSDKNTKSKLLYTSTVLL